MYFSEFCFPPCRRATRRHQHLAPLAHPSLTSMLVEVNHAC